MGKLENATHEIMAADDHFHGGLSVMRTLGEVSWILGVAWLLLAMAIFRIRRKYVL